MRGVFVEGEGGDDVDAMGWKGVYSFSLWCASVVGILGILSGCWRGWGAIGERCNALHDKKFTNEEQQNIVAKLVGSRSLLTRRKPYTPSRYQPINSSWWFRLRERSRGKTPDMRKAWTDIKCSRNVWRVYTDERAELLLEL